MHIHVNMGQERKCGLVYTRPSSLFGLLINDNNILVC